MSINRKHSDETKQKIRLRLLGHKHTPETIEKLRKIKTGKKHSEETKRKMGLQRLGRKHPPGFFEKMRNRKISDEHRENIRLSKLGELNPIWKGDNVKYDGLHQWVNTHKFKPELCEICNVKPPYDLANITGTYNRSLENWKHLCRKCHMLSDDRMKNLRKRDIKGYDKICLLCGSNKTWTSKTGYEKWHRHLDGIICVKCYQKGWKEKRRAILRQLQPLQ